LLNAERVALTAARFEQPPVRYLSAFGEYKVLPSPAQTPSKPPFRKQQLAVMDIRKVIFHDIPQRKRGADVRPDLSQIECPIDTAKVEILREKLVNALTSSAAYDLEPRDSTDSSVPGLVGSIMDTIDDAESSFVLASQAMAAALLDRQTGISPAGLLTVLECKLGSSPAVAILKLAREVGLQLSKTDLDGKATISMAVLGDLVLTRGTRLFKSALFVRQPDSTITVIACDDQRSYEWTNEMAQFWQSFLGCQLREEPRITTRRFFEATLEYINTSVADPVVKNDFYDHIFSELKAEKGTFAPKKFIEDYVPRAHKTPFNDFLKTRHIPLAQFRPDISEIRSQLKGRALKTKTGVRITAPEDSDVITVKKDQVIIDDIVENVGN
jgi:hypothetical protein